MSLFLLLSIPLTILVINTFFQTKSVEIKSYFLPILRGTVAAVVTMIIYFMFDDLIVLRNGFIQLYFNRFFYYDGFILSIYIIVWIVYNLLTESKQNKTKLRENAFTIGAFLFVFSVRLFLIRSNNYSLLELFLLPLLKLSVILLLSFTLSRVISNGGSERILWIVISLLIPFVFNFVPFVYLFNYKIVSAIATLVIFAGSSIIFYLETKGTFAGSPRLVKN